MATDAQVDAAFKAANDFIKSGDKSVSLDNATKLKFYGLYKQATDGPCKGKSYTFVNIYDNRKTTWPPSDCRSRKIRRMEITRVTEQERRKTPADIDLAENGSQVQC